MTSIVYTRHNELVGSTFCYFIYNCVSIRTASRRQSTMLGHVTSATAISQTMGTVREAETWAKVPGYFFFFTPSRFQTVSFLSHSKISWCGHPLPDSRGDLLSSFYHLALHWQGDHSVIKSEDYSVQNARKGGGGGRGEEERGSGRRRRGGGEEGEGIGHIWRAGGKFFCKMEVWESPGGGTSWDWPWEFKFEYQHRK